MNKRNYKNLNATDYEAFEQIHSDLASAYCHIDSVLSYQDLKVFSKSELAILENAAKRINKLATATFDAQTELIEARHTIVITL